MHYAIHHKDGNPLNNDDSNLSVLCPKCHQAEHRNNKKPRGDVYIIAVFKPKKRKQLLQRSNYRCAKCHSPLPRTYYVDIGRPYPYVKLTPDQLFGLRKFKVKCAAIGHIPCVGLTQREWEDIVNEMLSSPVNTSRETMHLKLPKCYLI